LRWIRLRFAQTRAAQPTSCFADLPSFPACLGPFQEIPSMSRPRRNSNHEEPPQMPDVAEDVGAASGSSLNLKLLKEKKINELAQLAKDFQIESASSLRKQDLIFSILQAQAEQ